MSSDRHRPQPWRDHHSNEVLTIDLAGHPRGNPLGILLAPVGGHSASSSPSESLVTIIAGWEQLPDGKGLGPIQRSGQVRLGDRLVRMNNVDVTNMTFREIMELLKTMLGKDVRSNASGARLRSLSFAPLSRSTKKEPIVSAGSASSLCDPQNQTQQSKLYTFKSSVHRARVQNCRRDAESSSIVSSDSNGGSSFVEYEISCRMVVRFGNSSYQISGNVEEKSWTVWKRFSDFAALDDKIRKSFGWQMNALNNGWGVTFPSSRVFSSILWGNLDKSFVEQRRFELEQYWQSVQKVTELFDFANPSSHRYPRDMSSFLDVEGNFPGRGRNSSLPSGGDERLTSNAVEQGDGDLSQIRSQTASQSSPLQSLKGSGSPAPYSSQSNDQFDSTHEEATADLCSHMKDIIFDSESVSSVRDTPPTRRRIGGAAKSAFQRKYLDSF